MVRVKVPATVANLGPGFDCMGMAVPVFNVIEIEEDDAPGLTIQIFGEGEDQLPRDETNLVWRACNLLFNEVGVHPKGVRLKLINYIPLARGLGSSASATVGGLTAANELLGSLLSWDEIIRLATKMEGHPDNVAAAVSGGVTVCWEEGDSFGHLSFVPPPGIMLVLGIPSFELPTTKARNVLPKTVSMQDAAFNVSRAALLVAALIKGEYSVLRVAMKDKLHQPYRKPLIPGMESAFDAALNAGALGVALSGAGPSIVAFVTSPEEGRLVADSISASFRENGIRCRTWLGPISAKGVDVEVSNF